MLYASPRVMQDGKNGGWLVLRRTTQPLILKLPNELLFQIQSLLPLASQVCLALSCKTLLELFKSVLGNEEFHFPRIYRIDRARLCNKSTTA